MAVLGWVSCDPALGPLFHCQSGAVLYAPRMARKDNESPPQPHGFHDVVGILLTGMAALLCVALFSYEWRDVPRNILPTNSPAHNWIGPFGAGLAYWCFFAVGYTAYLLPFMLAVLGLGCFVPKLAFLRRRWPWVLLLFLCCVGLLDLFKTNLKNPGENVNTTAGGVIGVGLNNSVFEHWFGLYGAAILYAMLYLISFVFLTNFQLGHWIRSATSDDEEELDLEGLTPEEAALQRKARELEKQAKKLQEQLEKSGRAPKEAKSGEAAEPSGLGADLKPVPEPTVRDLSVPQPRPGKPGKGKDGKETKPGDAPAEITGAEGDVIPAKEIRAATSADILGKPAEPKPKEASAPDAEPTKSAPAPTAPATPALPKPKIILGPPKAKPISVASTPKIGNYQLPNLDFLQLPDMTVKPTESKEELMSNAQLMKNTLAQFDIEVAIGDITKGPTITRYELHPAPGVKLERISALTNNIAAALKAERIHILAPVPGKSSVGVEVPNLIKTKVIMRDLLESEEWTKTKARVPLALGKDVYGHPIIADLAEMPHLLIAGSTGSGKSVAINSIIASLLYRFPPDMLRFVMIDPKVVELQQYNALPHLVVPVVTDPKKVILALRWVVN